MPFVEIIELRRCRKDGGTFLEHQGRELALFRTSDATEIIVLDNTCPHAGGNLSGGVVSDGIVSCPWHDWKFDLKTGICVHSRHARVTRYAAEVRDEVVWVDLPPQEAVP